LTSAVARAKLSPFRSPYAQAISGPRAFETVAAYVLDDRSAPMARAPRLRRMAAPMLPAGSQIEELIAAARQADAGALGRLLEHYRNYLALVARTSIDAVVRAKADPSDMVQETLIKAHVNFGQFQGSNEAELAAWLRQILANNVADLVRRFRAKSRNVSREVSFDDALRSSADAICNFVAGDGTSPSHHYNRREMSVLLADALATLSAEHREVIILRSIEDLDWSEVAEKMGRTSDAVRVLWARALKQLRPRVEERS
jgi:RNA polymerase sigma-70 factor (ECF subfamily)